MIQSHAKRSILSSLISILRNYRAYAALLLGSSFGLLVYSYWLVDHLPPISKLAIFYVILASLIGVVGYYLLLQRCIGPLLFQMSEASRWGLVIGSIVIGVYLTVAYLHISNSPPRYITFLLPREHLRIAVSNQGTAQGQLAILRITTSLGDVSYNSVEYQGWTRTGSDLVLSDPTKNALEWTGRTGEKALITFRAFHPGGIAKVSWNGEAQNISIAAGANGRYELGHEFPVPFYASQTLLLLVGALNFILLCCALNLMIWDKRSLILSGLEQSVSDLFHGKGGGAEEGRGRSMASQNILGWEWIAIACLLGLALLLRVFNLSNLYPYADEYAHLLAAKALLQGAPLNSVFDRSLLIVTIPVVISQRIFGIELWSARLPGTIFNALAILPLYLLTKKINKPVAVLCCLLYATSPWIIAVARNVREYAYYPFYFYWIVYGMVLLLERLSSNLVLSKDWKILFRPDLRVLSLFFFLAPIYAVFFDARSTFKIIAIAYGVFGLFLLKKLDLKSKSNLVSLTVLGTGIVVAGIAYAGLGHLSVPLNPHFNAEVLGYFFPNPVQQWYFDRPSLVAACALTVAVVLCLGTIRANFVPSFIAALFLASAIFFIVFFGHYLRPRYLMIVQFWYVILLALGLYGLFALQLCLPRKDIVLPLLTTALFAFTFNVSQSLMTTFYNKQGNMPITEEYHFNIGPAYTFLLDKVKSQDVLLSNFYGGYVRWIGAPTFQKIVSYGFVIPSLKYWWIFPYEAAETLPVQPHDYILSIVKDNNSGWIVLDSVTYSSSFSKPLSLKTTIAGDKEIDYVGYFGGEYIWQWHVVGPLP